MARIRVRIGLSVWWVSCYAHVFVLLWVVIVTLSPGNDLHSHRRTLSFDYVDTHAVRSAR